MKTKHTPGPYTCGLMDEKHYGSNFAWISGPMGCIAHVYPDREPNNAMANAQLMGAAPEMLAALQKAVKLARLDCKNTECTCIQCGVKREMLAAIAKAEGRS